MPSWYVASGPGVDGPAPDDDRGLELTTTRADLPEPAPAARPGRVHQAVELTLPDRDARRALFDLHRGDLAMDLSGLDEVLDRTDGVTALFRNAVTPHPAGRRGPRLTWATACRRPARR